MTTEIPPKDWSFPDHPPGCQAWILSTLIPLIKKQGGQRTVVVSPLLGARRTGCKHWSRREERPKRKGGNEKGEPEKGESREKREKQDKEEEKRSLSCFSLTSPFSLFLVRGFYSKRISGRGSERRNIRKKLKENYSDSSYLLPQSLSHSWILQFEAKICHIFHNSPLGGKWWLGMIRERMKRRISKVNPMINLWHH